MSLLLGYKIRPTLFSFTIFLLLFTSCGNEKLKAFANPIHIDNALKTCVTIEKKIIVERQKNIYLDIHYEQSKSIGECGCTSALSSINIYLKSKNDRRFLTRIDWVLKNGKNLKLPLASDREQLGGDSIEVELSCALPE